MRVLSVSQDNKIAVFIFNRIRDVDSRFIFKTVILFLPILNTASLHDNVVKLANNKSCAEVNDQSKGAIFTDVNIDDYSENNELVKENEYHPYSTENSRLFLEENFVD